ncbi:hypothetical protein [Pinirhizobacter soli]|uniref:hypothetical protein n=1 Tax=Pinirhizobacter soli TaxID=2786953 RepID=UPI00202A81A3|nr:hypothetical protein [Pinirhizobacter soli]
MGLEVVVPRGTIRLTIKRDEDGSCELIAHFASKGFSGSGSAYFDLASLAKVAVDFSAFPLSKENRPCIQGGYFDLGNSQVLSQEHLHISASPLGNTGRVRLLIRTSTPASETMPNELQRSASIEFSADYEQMRSLSRGLVHLAEGRCEEVIFEEFYS